MKKTFLFFSILSTMMMQTIQVQAEPFLFGDLEKNHLIVNNRILAKVNGKVISVVDLMKKMDMLFYRQFPEYASSIQARYQFYQVNWKHILRELVDKELIVADAEEIKLQISAGDIRQEMETVFGPNIIANLDKIGLTYDEASKMIHSDLTIRRMLYFRVHAKALKKVTPQRVRQYYEKHASENIRNQEWRYQVISIRGKDATKATELAARAHELLSNKEASLDSLTEKLKALASSSARMPSISISNEYVHTEKEISEAYKGILTKLEPGTFSEPFSQKSRADHSTVVRILHLKSMSPGGVIPIADVENKIREKLLEAEVEKETETYLNRLRKHFDVQEDHLSKTGTENFEPFMLK